MKLQLRFLSINTSLLALLLLFFGFKAFAINNAKVDVVPIPSYTELMQVNNNAITEIDEKLDVIQGILENQDLTYVELSDKYPDLVSEASLRDAGLLKGSDGSGFAVFLYIIVGIIVLILIIFVVVIAVISSLISGAVDGCITTGSGCMDGASGCLNY